MPGIERAPVIRVRDMDQRQPRRQFARAIADMVGKAVGHRCGGRRTRPESPFPFAATERSLGIPPQHRGERAFVTRRRCQRVDRRFAVLAIGARFRPRIAITGERGIFALHPGGIAARIGQGRLRRILRVLQFALARAACFEVGTRLFQRCPRRFDRAACLGHRFVGVAFARQLLSPPGLPRFLGRQPVEPLAGLFDRRLRNAPLGLDSRIFGRCLGQRQFRCARRGFGLLRLAGQRRAAFLIRLQRLRRIGQFGFQPP